MTKKRQSKSLGQVFLHDPNIKRKILAEADVLDSEHIVEIGCGEGVMSEPLSDLAKTLTIYEIDSHYLSVTQDLLQEKPHVSYVQGDVLKNTFSGLTAPSFRIVANIPYQISSGLIQLMTNERHRLGRSILLVQDDFAKKLMAKPGDKDYSVLTLMTRLYFQVEYLFFVSKNCFFPIPKVESAVIALTPLSSPLFDVDHGIFYSIVRSAFWGRRKTLRTCLLSSPYLSLPKSISSLPFIKNHGTRRGETLSIEEYFRLYNELKIYF